MRALNPMTLLITGIALTLFGVVFGLNLLPALVVAFGVAVALGGYALKRVHHGNEVERLRRQASDSKKLVSDLRASINKMSAKLGQSGQKIDSLQESLSSLRANAGRAVEAAVERRTAELHEEIAQYKRRLHEADACEATECDFCLRTAKKALEVIRVSDPESFGKFLSIATAEMEEDSSQVLTP